MSSPPRCFVLKICIASKPKKIYFRTFLILSDKKTSCNIVGDTMGSIQTKTDFQSLLVVSCLMFDLEHLIRVIVQFFIARQAREYRDIGLQSDNSRRFKDSETQVSSLVKSVFITMKRN